MHQSALHNEMFSVGVILISRDHLSKLNQDLHASTPANDRPTKNLPIPGNIFVEFPCEEKIKINQRSESQSSSLHKSSLYDNLARCIGIRKVEH